MREAEWKAELFTIIFLRRSNLSIGTNDELRFTSRYLHCEGGTTEAISLLETRYEIRNTIYEPSEVIWRAFFNLSVPHEIEKTGLAITPEERPAFKKLKRTRISPDSLKNINISPTWNDFNEQAWHMIE